MYDLSDEQCRRVVDLTLAHLAEHGGDVAPVANVHNAVERALDDVAPNVAKCYRDYHNYKQDFVHMLDDVYRKSQAIRYIGDRNNANTDSALVPTQRSLIYNELSSALYKKFFLNREEREAMKDGYIYIHDRSARLDTMNCFRRDTKFITSSGVKSFYDFCDGDEVIVRTHKGRWKKAIVHAYGHQPIKKVVISKGTPTSNHKEIYCTPNHRWILKDGTETTDLKVGDILWQVPDITNIRWEEMSLMEKKLWCKGFAMGDGSLNGETKSDGCVRKFITVRLCGENLLHVSLSADTV